MNWFYIDKSIKSGDRRLRPYSIDDMRERAEFVEITSAGMRESHVHDVQITKEAPNYHVE